MNAFAPCCQTDRPAATLPHRLIAAAVFLPSLGVLLLAVYLSPGQGLTQTMGFPGCGFKITTGLPCATCGMTTAFTYVADGRLLEAFWIQPAGAVLAVVTALLALVSGYALAVGMSLAPLAKILWRPRWVIALIVLIVVSWAYTLALTLLR